MLNLYYLLFLFYFFACQYFTVTDLHLAFCCVRLSILSFRASAVSPGVQEFIFSFQLPSVCGDGTAGSAEPECWCLPPSGAQPPPSVICGFTS